eukprot:gene1072-1621_t
MLGAFSPSAGNGDKRDAWLAHPQGQQLLYASPTKHGAVKTPENGATNFNSQSHLQKSLQQTFGPLADISPYNSLPNGLNGAVTSWQSAQQLQRSGMDEAYSSREDSMLAHIQNRFTSGHQEPRTDGLTGHVTGIDSNLTSSSQATVASPTLNLPVRQSTFPDRSWPSESPVLEFPESLSAEDGVGNWNMELEAMLDSCDQLPPSLPRRASFGLGAEPEHARGSQFILNGDANCSVAELPPTASRSIATGKLSMANGPLPTAPRLKAANGQMAKPPPPQPQQKPKKAGSTKAEIQQRCKERDHQKQVQQIRRTGKNAADKKARLYRKIKETAQKALKECEQLEEFAAYVNLKRPLEEKLKRAIEEKRLLDNKYQQAVNGQRVLQTKAEHAREKAKIAEDATEGTIEYEYVERANVHWEAEDTVGWQLLRIGATGASHHAQSL